MESIPRSRITVPRNIKLADEKFNESARVDLIIGAGLYWDLMCIAQIKLGKNQPTFKKTLLGLVVSGVAGSPENESGYAKCHVSINDSLNDSLRKFWELEHGLLMGGLT